MKDYTVRNEIERRKWLQWNSLPFPSPMIVKVLRLKHFALPAPNGGGRNL